MIAAQGLFNERGDAGEERVEAPVVKGVSDDNAPHWRRGEYMEPRGSYLRRWRRSRAMR